MVDGDENVIQLDYGETKPPGFPRDKINFLIAVPSPRDIPEVMQAHAKLREDILYAKYLTERVAYGLLRDYFLQHEEYSHLVLAPDDLVVETKHIEMLKDDLAERDYPVLSGICPVAEDGGLDKLFSITENLPHPLRPAIEPLVPEEKRHTWGYRWYAWYSQENMDKEIARQGKPIIRVWHTGFALQAIRRDVLKRIAFQTDANYQGEGHEKFDTSSTDVMFSNFCAISKIPLYADTRILMRHLRNAGGVEIQIGGYKMELLSKTGIRSTFVPKTENKNS